MIGYEPLTYKPERKRLDKNHWLSINCRTLEVDARRDFCVWAEEFVAEEDNGKVTNEFGEPDTMLYDVYIPKRNIYISVKSSSNAISVRDCITRSRVKANPLLSAISLRKPEDLFKQVYIQYIPQDRELLWFETLTITFKELLDNYNQNKIEIDSYGRLNSNSHDMIFGTPVLKKIIDLPEINHELETVKNEIVKSIKGIYCEKKLNKIRNILV